MYSKGKEKFVETELTTFINVNLIKYLSLFFFSKMGPKIIATLRKFFK